jgi:universal stress protein A
MHIDTILCPIDFSESNQSANEYASILAKSTGARIVYLHVTVSAELFGSYTYLEPADDQQVLQALQKIKPTIDGVECEHVIETGGAAECIVNYANSHEVSLIIMGTHGRTGLSRLLMGSVAEEVVRKAKCPVLAIKADTKLAETNMQGNHS